MPFDVVKERLGVAFTSRSINDVVSNMILGYSGRVASINKEPDINFCYLVNHAKFSINVYLRCKRGELFQQFRFSNRREETKSGPNKVKIGIELNDIVFILSFVNVVSRIV